MEMDAPSNTESEIERILCKAERDIQNVLISHYFKITTQITEELERLEFLINSKQKQGEITSEEVGRSTSQLEREETRLNSSLHNRRGYKLRKMKKMESTPPQERNRHRHQWEAPSRFKTLRPSYPPGDSSRDSTPPGGPSRGTAKKNDADNKHRRNPRNLRRQEPTAPPRVSQRRNPEDR